MGLTGYRMGLRPDGRSVNDGTRIVDVTDQVSLTQPSQSHHVFTQAILPGFNSENPLPH